MTPDLASAASTETILSAAHLMLANEIRHLAVTVGSATVGVVSIRDVLAALADDAGHRRSGRSVEQTEERMSCWSGMEQSG